MCNNVYQRNIIRFNGGIQMLDKQINMYSIDTSHFYSNHEKYLHEMNCKYRNEKTYINDILLELEQTLISQGFTKENISHWKSGSFEEYNQKNNSVIKQYIKWNIIVSHKRDKAKQAKEKLLKLLENKVHQKELLSNKIEYCKLHNIPYDKKVQLREIRTDKLNDNNIISVFESSLTRIIGIKQDELTDAIMIVQVYYFDIFKDLSFYGFMYNGEQYKYFTSSAGQIRKKKAVFIKTSVWDKIEKTIMCGLTIDRINSKGGNNVNKHLAYIG